MALELSVLPLETLTTDSYEWYLQVSSRASDHIASLVVCQSAYWFAKWYFDWFRFRAMRNVPNFNATIATSSCYVSTLGTKLKSACTILVSFSFANHSRGYFIVSAWRLVLRHAKLRAWTWYQSLCSSVFTLIYTKWILFNPTTLNTLLVLDPTLKALS